MAASDEEIRREMALLQARAALLEALALIGHPEKTDHDLAKIIVDNEWALLGLIDADVWPAREL